MAKSGVTDQIAAHRALETLPEVWAELALGRVGAEEALERARAQEPEALVERTARMLAPPTAEQKQARLQALLDAAQSAEAAPAPEPASAPAPATVIRPKRWMFGGVAALAAAAAVLLLVMPRGSELPAFEAGYELEARRALEVERDASSEPTADEVPRYRVDRTLELALRPGHRVVESVDVRAFAVRGDAPAIVLPVEPHRKGGGVLTIEGQPRAWGLEPGRWRLTLVVGPPEGLPEALADVRTDAEAPYDVASTWVEIEEAAPEAP
jgi:hypothetical protein